jgi:hypothetical protein
LTKDSNRKLTICLVLGVLALVGWLVTSQVSRGQVGGGYQPPASASAVTVTSSLPGSCNDGDVRFLTSGARGFYVCGAGAWASFAPGGRVSFLTSQFDKTTNTTFSDVPGLTQNVLAGERWGIRAVLHTAPSALGGFKYQLTGTATVTQVIYVGKAFDTALGAITNTNRLTALGGNIISFGATSPLAVHGEIDGEVLVNASGTLVIQFAQSVASGTSSVLPGSFLQLSQ